jgi:hypothetical protein
MNQIVHIFKKDVRRFSWEIGLSLSLTVLYAWCQPVAWRPLELVTEEGARYVGASSLGPLLVLAWMVMLTRLIYQESPVGNQQFWVTRPYRWPDLLAAKLLFVLAFITIPLLIAQLVLLAAAGFGVSHHLSVLLQIHLVLTVFLLLVAALAVVTAGAAQLTRAAFLVLIFLIASGLLGSSIDVPYRHSSIWDWPGRILLIVTPTLVIIRQYALRKTSQARWLLFGGAWLFLMIGAIQPAITVDEAQYPMLPSGSESYFEINLNPPVQPGKPDDALPSILTPADPLVEVVLHLSGTGVAEGQVVQPEAIRVTFQAPDGARWSSKWEPWQAFAFAILEHEASSEPDPQQTADIRLFVDRSFVERVRHVPITVRVTAAAALFRDQGGISVTPAQGELTVPSVGTCKVEQRDVYAPMVFCRTAQDPPPMMNVTARKFRSCPPSQSDLSGPPVRITAWTQDTPRMNGFRLSPVNTFSPLTERRNDQTRSRIFCPDSPFTFRLPELVRRFRVEKEFKNVRLVDYVERKR